MLPDTFSRTPAFSVPTSDKKHKFSWRFITALHWNLKSCRMIARYSPLMSAMHSATFGHLGSVIPSWYHPAAFCLFGELGNLQQGGIKIWWSELCDRPGYLVLVVRALPLNCCPSNSEHLWTLSCFVLHQLYNIPCLSFQICYRTFGLGCIFSPSRIGNRPMLCHVRMFEKQPPSWKFHGNWDILRRSLKTEK